MSVRIILVLAALAMLGATPAPSVRKACLPDVHRFCPGIPLLSARLKQCMKDHAEQLSDACKAAEAAREAASPPEAGKQKTPRP